MSRETYYIKRGRRYVPIKEYDPGLMDALPYGNHIISVREGGRSTSYHIDPAFGPMIAAGRYAQDEICRAMVEASELKPKRAPLTDEQKQAWDSVKRAFDDEVFYVQWPTVYEIAEAGVKAMSKEASDLLENPAVREAYEHFMTLARLALEQKSAK